MTYEKAIEVMEEMKECIGMRKVIKQGNPENENTYYVDYKYNMTMGMTMCIEPRWSHPLCLLDRIAHEPKHTYQRKDGYYKRLDSKKRYQK